MKLGEGLDNAVAQDTLLLAKHYKARAGEEGVPVEVAAPRPIGELEGEAEGDSVGAAAAVDHRCKARSGRRLVEQVLAGEEAENKQALAEDKKEVETTFQGDKSASVFYLYRLAVYTEIPALHRCGSWLAVLHDKTVGWRIEDEPVLVAGLGYQNSVSFLEGLKTAMAQ